MLMSTIRIDQNCKVEIGSPYKNSISIKIYKDGVEIYVDLSSKHMLEAVKAHYAISKE